MSEAINEERLNDYVDGLLSATEEAEVEGHLEASAEARETVEFLRALRVRAAELPASIEPSRDLWPELSARLAPAPLVSVDDAGRLAGVATRSWWPRLDTFQWATLAAAALFLMVTSSAITAWVVGVDGPAAGEGVGTAAISLDSAPPVEAAYVMEIEQLLWALDENRDTLDPETVTTIETNLRVINRAIGRARGALEEDPDNAGLTRMLTKNYRHKLQLLQRANRFIELS